MYMHDTASSCLGWLCTPLQRLQSPPKTKIDVDPGLRGDSRATESSDHPTLHLRIDFYNYGTLLEHLSGDGDLRGIGRLRLAAHKESCGLLDVRHDHLPCRSADEAVSMI